MVRGKVTCEYRSPSCSPPRVRSESDRFCQESLNRRTGTAVQQTPQYGHFRRNPSNQCRQVDFLQQTKIKFRRFVPLHRQCLLTPGNEKHQSMPTESKDAFKQQPHVEPTVRYRVNDVLRVRASTQQVGRGAWSSRIGHGTLRHRRRVWEALTLLLFLFLAWFGVVSGFPTFFIFSSEWHMNPISLHSCTLLCFRGVECPLFVSTGGPPWTLGLES